MSEEPSVAEQPRYPWLAFCILAAALTLHARSYFGIQLDDAIIALRYANNLHHGLGLTFNVGERVEGFTSPLATFLEAGFLALKLPSLTTLQLMGLAAGVVLVGCTMRLALELTSSRFAAVGAGAILVLQPWFALDCVNGLETSLFAAFTTGALTLYICSGHPTSVGVLLALGMLTRPEGALVAILLVGHAFLMHHQPTRFARVSLPILILTVPLLALKALYFGALVPNTALAKMPPLNGARLLSGLTYVQEFAPSRWDLLALVSLALFAMRGRIHVALLLTTVVVWITNVIFVGGDWMGPERFLMPVQPLLAVGLVSGAKALAGAIAPRLHVPRPVVAGIVISFAVLLVVSGGWASRNEARSFMDGVTRGTDSKVPLARWLKDAAPADATLATCDVGVIAYESELRIIDTGGLTDRKIAELLHAGDATYPGHLARPTPPVSLAIAEEVMGRQPELVLLNTWGADVPALMQRFPQRTGRFKAIAHLAIYDQDAGLLANSDFAHNYRFACSKRSARDQSEQAPWYNLFVRKDVELRVAPKVDDAGHPSCG